MACEKCEKAPKSAFYRWKNANLEVRGCDAHLREVFDTLNKAQRSQRSAPTVEADPDFTCSEDYLDDD